jgi:hypothetical protein
LKGGLGLAENKFLEKGSNLFNKFLENSKNIKNKNRIMIIVIVNTKK